MDSIRVGLETKSRVFDGYDVSWYHLACYKFSTVSFINQLRHYDLLRWSDFIKVREILGDTSAIDNSLEKQNYNNDIWVVKDALSNDLKPAQIKQIFTANYTMEVPSPAYVLHMVADGMVYGRCGPCPSCNGLTLAYDGNHFYCRGWATSFTKCDWNGMTKRYKFVLPKTTSTYIRNYTFPHAHPYEEISEELLKSALPKQQILSDEDMIVNEVVEEAPKRSGMKVRPQPGSAILKVHEQFDKKGTIEVEESSEFGYTPYNVTLVLTDMVTGSNSCFFLQLIKVSENRYYIFRKWGRIGVNGIGGTTDAQYSSLKDALKDFKEHFSDKTGYSWDERFTATKKPGKYYLVELADQAEEESGADTKRVVPAEEQLSDVPSSLPQETQDLLRILYDFGQMQERLQSMSFDPKKMPLGKISQKQIKAAYAVLTEIQNMLADKRPDREIMDASCRFYTLIPHNFGSKPPQPINNVALLTEKIRLVDTMADIEIANNLRKMSLLAGNSMDSNYATLNTNLVPIDRESYYFSYLEALANSTVDSSTKFTIQNIFDVDRHGEADTYSKWDFNTNKLLLWHGSRASSFVGILGNGLRIAPPESPKSGYRFGKGIYFADTFSVSLGYCGATTNYPTAILALAEVALGASDALYVDTYMESPAYGFQSTKALGMRAPVSFENFQDFTVLKGPVIATGLNTSCSHNEYIGSELISLDHIPGTVSCLTKLG
eukprot:gene19090-22862_t